ncbi:MAG: NAD(+)/NADH kinase [Lachnospiraceae bacterium]|nr:NAD(+)/NADH kinase [Lachnospiraceae bacterium]
MKHFCIVANRGKEGAFEFAEEIKKYIDEKGGICFIAPSETGRKNYTSADDIPKDTECVIVLGGDGTFLQTARDLVDLNLPMVGINLGSLGFLTMTESVDAYKAVDLLFNNQYMIDYRMQLSVNAKGMRQETALNDIVVSRGGYSHLVGITVYVDDQLFGSYEGDGVIVSTPTGSTGYNLSTGGPIVAPNVGAMIITPICPHAFNARSFVISADSKVRIVLKSHRHKCIENAYVTIDGEEYTELRTDEEIYIEKSPMKCKMCMLQEFSFIDMINNKLT